ncbi:hypothetical protein ACHAXH_007019 [Discostella pseudostelligera]
MMTQRALSNPNNNIVVTLKLLLMPLLCAVAATVTPFALGASSSSSSSVSSLAFSQPWPSSAAASSPSSSCYYLRRYKKNPFIKHRRHATLPLPPPPQTMTVKSITTATSLHMSCIPDDNDNNTENTTNNKRNKVGDDNSSNNNFVSPFDLNLNLPKFRPTLPPPPEDRIALSGDILALFVYSYMDHTINEMYAQLATKSDIIISSTSSSSSAVELLDAATSSTTVITSTTAMVAAAPGIQHLPVWFDTTHLQTFGSNWLAITHIDTPYAPAIASSGLAFVCITTSWLLCGYISGAFLHRNTIECNPTQAMIVTFQTWMGTALLMILLALGSDKLWSALDNINALSPQARGGLTKADADYIFDSLSVLGFWRFMLNWFLGYR